MNEKICYLVGAGEASPLPEIKENDLLIAVDGGLCTCLAQKKTPHLLVGDLDSLSDAPPPEIPLLRFPVKKDETDTYLAYLEGVRRGYKHFEIYGGLGGRADHTIANLQLLRRIAGEGNTAVLVGTDARMEAFADRETTLQTHIGQPLGVFALSEVCEGVSIRGAEYNLENGILQNDFPLGVSNTAKENEVKISVKKGTLLCVLSK
jgi:thiamine pyrophosphokinase